MIAAKNVVRVALVFTSHVRSVGPSLGNWVNKLASLYSVVPAVFSWLHIA